ncbi:MAG: hypothetical protein R3C40_02975 [Parvularculaceae bacterium]
MNTSALQSASWAVRRSMLDACFWGVSIFLVSAASHAAEADTSVSNETAATAAFDRLKALEGAWRVADPEDHPLRIKFYPTAGGSSLVESWEVNGRSHSLTIYHRDGNKLLATHYCPQGNQPRMELTKINDEQISFAFHDITDLDAESEQYQHDLAFNLYSDDHIIRSEQYRDGSGGDYPSQLNLSRISEDQ